MKITNVHERRFAVGCEALAPLIDRLASPCDALWPGDCWPPMRLDEPLGPGASGGHGPIRYVVETYDPGRLVRFRFWAPRGFVGTHEYIVVGQRHGGASLRHVLEMRAEGRARLTWPIVFQPLHDALIEDSLDRAAVFVGERPVGSSWSRRVRALRWLLLHLRPRLRR